MGILTDILHTNRAQTSILVERLQVVRQNLNSYPSYKFVEKHLLSRLGSAVSIPFKILAGTFYTAVGVAASVISACSLNKYYQIHGYALITLEASDQLSSSLTHSLLSIINPNFKNISDHHRIKLKGIFHTVINSQIEDFNRQLADGGFFQRHIALRLSHFLAIIALPVARIADTVIGVIALIFAVITLGSNSELNALAVNNIRITGVVKDVMKQIMMVINPHV